MEISIRIIVGINHSLPQTKIDIAKHIKTSITLIKNTLIIGLIYNVKKYLTTC